MHGADAAVPAADTQLFSRTFTFGVTAVTGTVIVRDGPDTPVATVEVPSVTSYVTPAGRLDAGVHDTRQVVDVTRVAVTAVGSYGVS